MQRGFLVDGNGLPDPSYGDLRAAVGRMLGDHWVPEGYAAPNSRVYPWQWLWDSCFHVLVWQALGEVGHAQRELEAVFDPQAPSGFVPHMNYARDPGFHEDLWGRRGGSSITQPPMYGHAVAELIRAGSPPPDRVVEAAVAGMRFLLDQRVRDRSGLLQVCHPWETGCDDSPRWDDACPGGYDRKRWVVVKDRLVSTIRTGPDGSPLSNPDFPVAPVGFNALVAFNAGELAEVVGDDRLAAGSVELAGALTGRWFDEVGTWVDAGSMADGSGRVRTLDSFLPLLVDDDPARVAAVMGQLTDPVAHGGPAGPTGVHRGEASYDPDAYWRGPVWPQLAYLMVLAAGRHSPEVAADLARTTVAGAWASGLAEYWHPDSGAGLGAVPQSWTGLALLLAARRDTAAP